MALKTANGYTLALHTGPFEDAETATEFGEHIMALMAGMECNEKTDLDLVH